MTTADAATRVRDICMKLPAATEKVSHGHPTFFIEKGRIFAWFLDNAHGSGVMAVAVKTSGAEEQEMLVDHDPELYFRPAYLAPSGWIGMRVDLDETDWDHVADRIESSWARVAPRKLIEAHSE